MSTDLLSWYEVLIPAVGVGILTGFLLAGIAQVCFDVRRACRRRDHIDLGPGREP